jgi:hypothetical protein
MDRRRFIQTTVAAAGALALTDVTLDAQALPTALEKVFRNPPEDAGLSIVYHWTGGAVTKEGITADMEGIAASGIRIVNWFYFDGTGPANAEGIPTPTCLTPEWWGYVEHLMSEAKRLNLVVAPHVCSSWGPAGAAGITPELSQQQLVWSETNVQGGQPFTGALPRPERPPAAQRGGPPAAAPQTAAGSRGAVPGAAPAGAAMAAGAPGGGGGRGGPSFPPSWRSYYRDLAVLAFPVPAGWGESSVSRNATVTSSLPITDLAKAADPNNNERVVSTDKAGWIQFAFERPFTLRAVTMNPGVALAGPGGGGAAMNAANPYRVAHGLEVQASDDGTTFRTIGQLNPMGNGWQTRGVNALTHTVTETTARAFRLVYTPGPPIGYDEGMRTGTRTGGGDFQNMIEPLGFASVLLSSTPTVHHLPCKNMTTWGWSRLATDAEVPASACVPLSSVVDLTDKMQEDGTVANWTPGPGTWKVQRIGYTTQLNSTGGGLHCDKLSADAARIVFDSWFGEIRKRIPGSDTFITILNIDSWEGGSQNWSPLLAREFRTRRGYDITKYLPCMTGVMVESASATEGFLLDLRRTISECVAEHHYGTMARLAHQAGAIVMTEAVNPAIAVDGMEYCQHADWVGSEFWVRAGQNWKPNDVRDATAGARIYGKKVHFSEAFTGGAWQDHPFGLKAMGDHHYTEGVNRMMLHVWNEQYVPTRAPGVPGAGTPFNHTNTWWKAGQAWRDYMKKAQALLQSGEPVNDILYFAGENIPCRSILNPEHGSAWAADPAPPDGFTHDTINRDGLLRLTRVKNGRIVVNENLSYRALVLRASEPYLTPKVAAKLKELVEAGAVVVGPRPTWSPSLELGPAGQQAVRQVAAQLWGSIDGKTVTENRVGKGRVFWGRPLREVLTAIGVSPDCSFTGTTDTATRKPVVVTANSQTGTNPVLVGAERKGWGVEYLHKQGPGYDFYFVSNQEYFPVSTEASFRVTGRVPELWSADSGRIVEAPVWREQGGRTVVPLDLDPAGSVFVVFRKASAGADPIVAVGQASSLSGASSLSRGGLRLQKTAAGLEAWASADGEWTLRTKSGRSIPVKAAGVPAPIAIAGAWAVTFPLKGASKQLDIETGSWTANSDETIKYYSGTATYRKTFDVPAERKVAGRRLLLDLGDVQNLSRVRLNGKELGVLWKAPYVVDITAVVVAGANRIELEVTNTWFNRMAGDVGKPEAQRVTWSGAGGRGFGGGAAASAPPPLLPSGLIGPVRLVTELRVSPSSLRE